MLGLFRISFLLALCVGLSWGYGSDEDYDEEREVRNSRNCICNNGFVPFCGTDGVTYENKCRLECAQASNRGLRVKFEGVCAKPYIHQNGGDDRRIVGDGGRGRQPGYIQRIVGDGGRGRQPGYGNPDQRIVGDGGRGRQPGYGNPDQRIVGDGGRGRQPGYDQRIVGDGGRGRQPGYDQRIVGDGGRGRQPGY